MARKITQVLKDHFLVMILTIVACEVRDFAVKRILPRVLPSSAARYLEDKDRFNEDLDQKSDQNGVISSREYSAIVHQPISNYKKCLKIVKTIADILHMVYEVSREMLHPAEKLQL
uniref:Uncharacterized protein n=1 Tax=Phlebotomus papatasi TaxID=29031 RepID=A0A1B0GMC3_PHLPP